MELPLNNTYQENILHQLYSKNLYRKKCKRDYVIIGLTTTRRVFAMHDRNLRIGKKIKSIRKSLGMNQSEFAHKIDATVSAVSNWENGRNMPNNHRLNNIAEIADVSLSEFFEGIDDKVSILNDFRDTLKALQDSMSNSSNYEHILYVNQLVDNYNLLYPENTIE